MRNQQRSSQGFLDSSGSQNFVLQQQAYIYEYSRSGHQVEGIIMKLFVVVVVDVVVVVVVFLTETNDTTKRVELQQVSLVPPPPLVESRRNRVS